jgi:phage terminase large subunit GpA-like protein
VTTLAEVRARSLKALIPPARIRLSEWVEKEIVLPSGTSALPGAYRAWPFQTEILDAIGSAGVERITLLKSVRVGLSTMIVGAVANFIVNDPSPILLVLPTESDARDVMVSDVEPIFAASPALRGALSADVEEGERAIPCSQNASLAGPSRSLRAGLRETLDGTPRGS